MSEMPIDGSVYPDLEAPPRSLPSEVDRADHIERICGAWDFDIFPERETIYLLRGWKTVFDRFPLPHSPAYHTFRASYGWDPIPYLAGGIVGHLTYQVLDRLEGRTDPCEGMV